MRIKELKNKNWRIALIWFFKEDGVVIYTSVKEVEGYWFSDCFFVSNIGWKIEFN